MATCLNLIKAADLDNLITLKPNIETLIKFDRTTTKSLISLRNAKNENIEFKFKASQSFNGTLICTFFYIKLIPTLTIINIGNIDLDNPNITVSKSLSEGLFVCCVTNSTDIEVINLGITAKFTNYPVWASLFPKAGTGEKSQCNLTLAPPKPKPCSEPITYQVLDGKLPPGIRLEGDGTLTGILPNLDCLEELSKISGSNNWYHNLAAAWRPYGYQWRFKVKAWIKSKKSMATYPAIKWFCIEVHNNWDWDTAKFLENRPFQYRKNLDSNEDTIYIKIPQTNTDTTKPDYVIGYTIREDKFVKTDKEKKDTLTRWYNIFTTLYTGVPSYKEFIDNFKKTVLFESLREQIDVLKDSGLTLEEREIIILKLFANDRYKNLIQGRNEEDIDHRMIVLKAQENRKFPLLSIHLNIIKIEVTLS